MRRIYGAVFALLFSMFLYGNSQAQQTIFNVLTTDVLNKGKIYVELDAAFKFNNQEALSKFSSFVPCGVGAVEAAGDVNTLLLDKTGTITLGNRQSAEFIPLSGVSNKTLADAAQLLFLADETPEGRSIVVLAREKYGSLLI